MYLYIVRHAQAFEKIEDPKRPLNATGVQQAESLNAFIKRNKVIIKNIFHSPVQRAEETAEIIASDLPELETQEALSALEPEQPIDKLLQGVNYFKDNTLIVGHNPNMELLGNFLLSGDPTRGVVSFEPASMMCLKKENDFWQLQWFVRPALL